MKRLGSLDYGERGEMYVDKKSIDGVPPPIHGPERGGEGELHTSRLQ